MKNTITILCLLSFTFVNVEAKSEHLDIMYLSSANSIGNIFKMLNLTMENIPKISPTIIEKVKKLKK